MAISSSEGGISSAKGAELTRSFAKTSRQVKLATAMSTQVALHARGGPNVKRREQGAGAPIYEEIDKGNLDAMDELVAEDYLDRNPSPFPGLAPGREGLKQAFKIFWKATPGYHRVDEQIAEGDKVVTRLTAIGKHEGDLPGAPRTGNDLTMTSITIHRIANGKLVEKWSEKDVLGFLTQIGVMRPPGQQQG